MRKSLSRRPSASMVVAMLALVVASSGTAIAATQMSGDKLLKQHSLSGNRLRNHTITGTQVNLSQLGTVPSAVSAEHATTASSADTATSAATATNATNAANAGNATDLGGQPASAFLPATALARTGLVTVPAGTTGTQVLANGPLSVTLDCTQTMGVTTATFSDVSTVGNWIDYVTVEAAPGNVMSSSVNDASTPGLPLASVDSADLVAPSGVELYAEVLYGVNWPSAGECYYIAHGFA